MAKLFKKVMECINCGAPNQEGYCEYCQFDSQTLDFSWIPEVTPLIEPGVSPYILTDNCEAESTSACCRYPKRCICEAENEPKDGAFAEPMSGTNV